MNAGQTVQVLSGMEVGVVGAASTRSQPCAEWTAMDDYAALISSRTPLHAVRPRPRTRHRGYPSQSQLPRELISSRFHV